MKKGPEEKPPLEVRAGSVTVKIYSTQSAGYDEHVVCWYLGADRKRKKFSDLAEAKDYAHQVAAKLANNEAEVLQLSPEDQRIYVDARQTLQHCGVSLDIAVRQFKQAHDLLEGHPLLDAVRYWKKHQGKTITEKNAPDVAQMLLNALKADGYGEDHIQEMSRFLKKFSEKFPGKISDVTPAEIDDFLRGLQVSGSSRNIYRRKLVTLFNFARRNRFLADERTAADNSSKAKDSGHDIEIYSTDEMTQLLENASPGILPYVILSGFCGLRPAEIRRLDWRDINFKENYVQVSSGKSKTRIQRYAPLSANAKAWLKPISKAEGQVLTLVEWQHAILRLAKKAKVNWKRNALRHSWVSYRLALTQNPNQTALEAGHTVKVQERDYRRPLTKANGKKWFSILPKHRNIIVLPKAASIQRAA